MADDSDVAVFSFIGFSWGEWGNSWWGLASVVDTVAGLAFKSLVASSVQGFFWLAFLGSSDVGGVITVQSGGGQWITDSGSVSNDGNAVLSRGLAFEGGTTVGGSVFWESSVGGKSNGDKNGN